MIWEASDEHWHQPTEHPHWNESFYFNVFDADTGWACAARVGATPNAGEQDSFICLYFPDDSTGFVRTSQALDGDHSRIAAGGLELLCVEPFRVWQIRYDGPIHCFETPAARDELRRTVDPDVPSKHLRLDLEARSLHEPFDYGKRSLRMRPARDMLQGAFEKSPWQAARKAFRTLRALPAMTQASHYEQSVAVRGSLSIEGAETPIAGLGQRDHSWGVRDMRAPARWRWLSCSFGEDFAFNATQVDVLGMRVLAGFVLHEGAAERLRSWRYEPRHETSAYWPDALSLALSTESGRRFTLDAEVATPLPVIAQTNGEEAVVTASRARYRWGDRTAVGMIELMEQLP